MSSTTFYKWRAKYGGMDTSMITRLIRTARNEWLNMHIFDSIEHAQNLATQWMWAYNNERPHSSIGGIPKKAT